MNRLKTELLKLNAAQRGSFGEYIFANVAASKLRLQPKKKHADRVDFLVGEKRVDVKTTFRGFENVPSLLGTYKGKRESGVMYALVEFFSTGVRVSLEGQEIGFLNETEATTFREKWKQNRSFVSRADGRAEKRKALAPIELEIKEFFQEQGLEARVIHRTVQKGFGKESPHNLKPTAVKDNHVTVFLDFKNEKISRENIQRVFAFPDRAADTLPMLEKTNLHLPKVDLNKMPSAYVFESLDDLKVRYALQRT